jgi:hypothetical protein
MEDVATPRRSMIILREEEPREDCAREGMKKEEEWLMMRNRV